MGNSMSQRVGLARPGSRDDKQWGGQHAFAVLDAVFNGSSLFGIEFLFNGTSNGALFISRYGKQKRPAQLGTQITRFISDETGLVVNVHLFRHLAGYIYLNEHPGEYEPVRQLLGHKSIKTTVEFYTGLEEASTFRRYDEILDRRGRLEAMHASP